MGMGSKKPLPTKICPRCNRSFTWRKKWARDWENVVYCSKACRDGRYPSASVHARR